MQKYDTMYIDGGWVYSRSNEQAILDNPATEQPYGTVRYANAADVDLAVRAARRAFESFSKTSLKDRIGFLSKLQEAYSSNIDKIAEIISQEMGAPITLSKSAQALAGAVHLQRTIEALESMKIEAGIGTTLVVREPYGVCGLITPWNWPMNQIVAKVAAALAAGCSVVLKPSEITPGSGELFARIVDQAGLPKGVFNLVQGNGPLTGAALAAHPDVDLVSFTGSTRAGVEVARLAAATVKRVHQELGGKSPYLVAPGANLRDAVTNAAQSCFRNSGQSCNAPTRLLVENSRLQEAASIATEFAASLRVGDPRDPNTDIGPVASKLQYEKVRSMIKTGIEEGALIVYGGLKRPEDLDVGYFIMPTIFSCRNDMAIAREEIFGPVLSIIGYNDLDEAVAIANDTQYGLSSYVFAADVDGARKIARRLRTGMVHINGAKSDSSAPFGGYKQSGNGREWGRYGIEEYLEIKSIFGYSS